MATTAAQLPPFKTKAVRPAFIPYNLDQLQGVDVSTAEQTYRNSAAFQAAQTPDWAAALKVGQKDILNDVTGDTTLIPAVQAEAVRAGLGDALGAFGDAGQGSGTLTAGSAGAAKVSQNLFGTTNALNQQIRDNQYRALQVGSQVYPEQQIGLSGADAAIIAGANTLGQNSWGEANYEDKLANDRFNYNVQAANQQAQIQQSNTNAAAAAQSKSATQGAAIQGGAAIAGVAVLAIAL